VIIFQQCLELEALDVNHYERKTVPFIAAFRAHIDLNGSAQATGKAVTESI
jgi:hypothetical protein